MKVALIIGVFGSCRRVELKDMSLDQMHFCDNPNGVLITLPKTKTDVIRQFVVGEGDDPDINLINVIKKYAALRPPNTDTQRFFMGYRKSMCSRQPIGIHSFAGYPKIIATFLNCYRRSGVSLMAESGASLSDMRRHCGWISESMAEGYIETSYNNKRQIAGHILGVKATSTITSSKETVQSTASASSGVSVAPNSVGAVGSVVSVNSVDAVNSVGEIDSVNRTVRIDVTNT